MKAPLLIVILVLMSIVVFSGCSNSEQTEAVDERTGKMMLVNEVKVEQFQSAEYAGWFTEQYDFYEPDDEVLALIKDNMESISFKIFLGTWCKDSKREVPRFLKILDGISYDLSHIEFVGLDRAKTCPGKLEKGYGIEFVPTIIVNKNGNEIGRIIEYPIISLEQDLLVILTGIVETVSIQFKSYRGKYGRV
ncbi:MAG: thioredoxin family protein [Candidatus Neomarinimicrobiota bacterium]